MNHGIASPLRRAVFALNPVVLFLALALAPAAAAQTESDIANFTGANGNSPWAGMIFDQSGNLYGTTSGGGTYGAGTVFELTPTSSGWQETVLYSFANGADGKWPYGGLVFDNAGNLYGVTFGGGIVSKTGGDCYFNGCGTVFELSPVSGGGWTKTILHTFTGGKDGYQPICTLVLDSLGNLYGTTLYGGNPKVNGGVVFELSPSSSGWTEKVLHAFTGGIDGRTPYSGVVFDSAGNLYGTASSGGNLADCNGLGCGVVYKLFQSNGVWRGSVLHAFTGADGSSPWALPTLDSAGNLYGAAQYGGASGLGSVYRLSPHPSGHWSETVLYSFESNDGQWPQGGVLLDSSGNVYGTTYQGGAGRDGEGEGTGGVVYELSPQSGGVWQDTVLVDFSTGKVSGGYSSAGLVSDSVGNIYGTTQYGGSENGGIVFEITP
jgi:uncharacterized repeat protein (TIGR03803 family)